MGALGALVRHAAGGHSSTIGRDIMSVVIPWAADPNWIDIAFLPDEERVTTITTRGEPREVPVAYSPWVITTNVKMQPAVIAGGDMQAGGQNVQIRLRSPLNEGISFMFGRGRPPPSI